MTTTTRYRVDAFVASGQRIASETIEADASDSALHEMAERHPKAERFAATPIPTDDALRETIRDQLGVDVDADELRDVRLMLQRADEDSLLDFFGDATGDSGGLTRDGCIAVANLVADFGAGECGRPGCAGYKPDHDHELAF